MRPAAGFPLVTTPADALPLVGLLPHGEDGATNQQVDEVVPRLNRPHLEPAPGKQVVDQVGGGDEAKPATSPEPRAVIPMAVNITGTTTPSMNAARNVHPNRDVLGLAVSLSPLPIPFHPWLEEHPRVIPNKSGDDVENDANDYTDPIHAAEIHACLVLYQSTRIQ